MSRLTYTLTALGLLLAAGCSGADPEAGPAPPSEQASVEAAADEPVPTPLTPPRGPVSERCGEPEAPARWIRLRGPDQDRLAAVVVGEGPVTAVYSHQSDPEALCGFWPYAVWLAEEYGVRSVLLDHCGSGGSACAYDDFHDDLARQVEVAVDWAREHGASRVSLVGASRGGTTAIVAASRIRPSVDAVVDLSGPLRSLSLDALGSAPRVTAPTLLALAPDDGVATMADFRSLLGRLGSSTKRFVRAESGHGWETLGWVERTGFEPSPLAATVAAWLRGDVGT
jgi:dienelactone hydrolase